MRKDMKDVISEPGKTGKGTGKNPYLHVAQEDLPNNVKMRTGYDYNSTGMNYGPFKRWLEKQIGRPWNDVYSEAKKALKGYPGKQGWGELRDLLRWNVEINVTTIDGKFYSQGYCGLSLLRDKDLYVHPDTDILCKYVAPKVTPRAPKPETFRLLKKYDKAHNGHIEPVHALYGKPQYWYDAIRNINGIWYYVEGYYASRFTGYHWNHDAEQKCHNVFKRQLNSKELKKYSVKNN